MSPAWHLEFWNGFRRNVHNPALGTVHVFFSPPNNPDRHLGPRSLLFSSYRSSFPGIKRSGRDVDTHHHLSPRLKKNRAILLNHPPLYVFVVWIGSTLNFSPFTLSSIMLPTIRTRSSIIREMDNRSIRGRNTQIHNLPYHKRIKITNEKVISLLNTLHYYLLSIQTIKQR